MNTPGNSLLALAMQKLEQRDPVAGDLFAGVIAKHDVREAWLGLAISRHLQGETVSAGVALAHALSSHAVTKVPSFADYITRSIHQFGWCALNSEESLIVRLVRRLPGRSRLSASLDGRPIRLKGALTSGNHLVQLPPGWQRSGKICVCVDDVDLLGSALDLTQIAHVEGFVDSRNGDLHGWAWCPNDPDHDPVLTVAQTLGGRGIEITASTLVEIATDQVLARQRSFLVPAHRLSGFNGPLHIFGRDGRDLTGSPINPFAERRSAEQASRLIANLYPAPGQNRAMVPQDPTFLAVAAAPMGSRTPGPSKRRPVDVVIPVYGEIETTLACLNSVLSDLPVMARVVVVDDASPDPRVDKKLGALAAAGSITLLTNAKNLGFPGTANAGMRHDPSRDVVLLNSDTLVPPGWLTSLRDAAYSAPDIGSATPLSNDATILSYPSVEQSNAIPDLNQTIRLHTLAQAANPGCLVDIPTAVGFCVYIKRNCLNDTGLLREDVFAQGYGEENDFCIRARHLGWRHVAVPSVFVAHVGGQSFGTSRRYLIERNMRKLNLLHPGYDAIISEFQRVDPMGASRRRLDIARWQRFRTEAQSVLLITHARHGGVQRRVAERAAALRTEGFRPIMIWPIASRTGEGRDCVLGDGLEGGTPNLRFSIPAELDTLAELLLADGPVRAEVHHLIGHDRRLLELLSRLNVPYDMIIHDYSWICPRINLVGAGKCYCGEPEIEDCEACVADAGALIEEDISPGALRERSGSELAGASAIIVPSADVGTRLKRHFPSLLTRIVNWEDDQALAAANPRPRSNDGVRRVCVVGAIGIEKGYEVLLACARDAKKRMLKLEFHLVGYSCDDARLLATGRVHISGRYEEHEAVPLIRRLRAHIAWLPSVWPETWCYTLTEMWQAGLNVLAFDIGAQAERIRRTQRGWLCPLGLSPRALNDRMLALRPTETGAMPLLFWRGSR